MTDRDSRAPHLPDWIGRYEVLLPIASGGMATVYLARSRGVGGFERDVALKVTHAHLRESPEFAADLLEEAKLAVRIRHPHVVPVLDVGEDLGSVFLVMEYVEGDTLSGLIRKANAAGAPLAPGVGLRILCDALAGLHAAHELQGDDGAPLGVVHRDFSPQNILIGVDGMSRLTDFGIAKAVSRLGHTRTGNIKGKISYMSPEQARGQPLDRRCDVWAGGVMAWELLAGRRLYSANSDDVATLLRLVTELPPLLRSVDPEIPELVEDVVARALTIDLARRTPTADDLARAIVAACESTGIDLPPSAEVGAVVKRLVGGKLTERRLRAKEIVELRARMGTIATSGRESFTTTPSERARPARPSAEPAGEVPTVPLAALGMATPPPAATTAAAATTVEVERTQTDTTSVSDARSIDVGRSRVVRWVARHRLASAAIVLALPAVLLSGLAASRPGASPAVNEAGPAPAPAPPPTVVVAEVPEPSAPPIARASRRIQVKSDTPLAALTANGSAVSLPAGAREASFDAPEGDAVTFEAKSVDGRHLGATAAPDATQTAFTFGAPPAAAARAASPLVANPYGKKK